MQEVYRSWVHCAGSIQRPYLKSHFLLPERNVGERLAGFFLVG